MGALFHPVATVDLSPSIWRHTFVIKLPNPGHAIYRPKAILDVALLQNITSRFPNPLAKGTTRHIEVLRQSTDVHLKQEQLKFDKIRKVHKELQDYKKEAPTRLTRALAPWIGQHILQPLFGVMPEVDFKKFHASQRLFRKFANTTSREIMHLEDDMVSMSRGFSKRAELIETTEAIQEKQINYLRQQATEDTEMMILYIAHTSHTLYVRGSLLSQATSLIYMELKEEVVAFREMYRHRLPSKFVPTDVLKPVLNHIQSVLANNNLFSLTHTDISYYHNEAHTSYYMEGDDLFINLEIPISSYQGHFNVFAVNTFPLPTTHTVKGYTQIQAPTDYFGITLDHQFFLTMSTHQWLQCHGTNLKYCTHVYSVMQTSQELCITALFYGNLFKIKEHCTVAFKTDNSEAQILKINQTTYLLSLTNVDMESPWTVRCQGKPAVTVNPFELGYLSLNCSCEVRSDQFWLLPSLDNCIQDAPFRIQYPVNVIEMMHTIENLNTFNLSHTLPVFVTNTSATNFANLSHYYQDVLQIQREVALNYTKILEVAKGRKVAYKDSVDKLFDQMDHVQDSLTYKASPFSILELIATSLSIISLLLSIFLACKMFCVPIQLLPTAAALSSDVNNIFDMTQALGRETHYLFNIFSKIVMLLLFIISIGVIIFAYRNMSTYVRTGTRPIVLQSVIYFIIYTKDWARKIKIMTTPFPANQLKLITGNAPHTFYPPHRVEFLKLATYLHALTVVSEDGSFEKRLPAIMTIACFDMPAVFLLLRKPFAFKIVAADPESVQTIFFHVYTQGHINNAALTSSVDDSPDPDGPRLDLIQTSRNNEHVVASLNESMDLP